MSENQERMKVRVSGRKEKPEGFATDGNKVKTGGKECPDSSDTPLMKEANTDSEIWCRKMTAIDLKWTRRLPWSPRVSVDSVYVGLNLELVVEIWNSWKAEFKKPEDIISGLKGEIPPRSVLLSGPTGCGKSTFLRKLAYRWAKKDSGILGMISGLLLISLTDFAEDKNLNDVIDEHFRLIFGTKSETFMANAANHFLFLLDGYDEASEKIQSQLMAFLQPKSRYFCSHVVVTTRKIPSDDFLHLFVRHVKITKMENAMLWKEIGNSFQSDYEKVAAVKHFLNKNKRIVDSLQGSPLVMYCLCYVLETEQDLGISDTSELCYKVIFILLKRNDSSKELGYEDIHEILSKLGELFMECYLRRKHKISHSKLSSIFAGHLKIILRSGLFHQKDSSSRKAQEEEDVRSKMCRSVATVSQDDEEDGSYEMLMSAFTESLAFKYCNSLSLNRDEDKRREILFKELFPKIDCTAAALRSQVFRSIVDPPPIW